MRLASAIPEADLDAILWDHPRPRLREVIPVLLRKLEARWAFADPDLVNQTEDVKMNRPIPQYLTGATFEDLDVSEARIVFPDLQNEKGERYMSVARVLFESSPGNISKRYSVRLGEAGRWLAFSKQLIGRQGRSSASIVDLYPSRLFLENVDNVNVYQVQEATLEHRPDNILDTSKSQVGAAKAADPLAALRAVPAERLPEASRAEPASFDSERRYGPVVDGHVLVNSGYLFGARMPGNVLLVFSVGGK